MYWEEKEEGGIAPSYREAGGEEQHKVIKEIHKYFSAFIARIFLALVIREVLVSSRRLWSQCWVESVSLRISF